ncbi:MAG: hypothetical protein JW995_04385 [Melioribacteraceae bacterium]|nr:hypothetical protein [Melioribacteraceae bacterium]
MFRIVLFAIVFYFIFKSIKIIMRLFSEKSEEKETFVNTNYKRNQRSKIDKKDVIEADFEELGEKEKEK